MNRFLACGLLHVQRSVKLLEVEGTADQLHFEGIQSDKNVKKGVWSQIKAYKSDSDKTGGLVIRSQATAVLGITRSRMCILVNEGRFEVYKHFGKEMFGADEILEYARIAKISGKGGVAQKAAWDATKTEMKKDVEAAKAIFKKAKTAITSR